MPGYLSCSIPRAVIPTSLLLQCVTNKIWFQPVVPPPEPWASFQRQHFTHCLHRGQFWSSAGLNNPNPNNCRAVNQFSPDATQSKAGSQTASDWADVCVWREVQLCRKSWLGKSNCSPEWLHPLFHEVETLRCQWILGFSVPLQHHPLVTFTSW